MKRASGLRASARAVTAMAALFVMSMGATARADEPVERGNNGSFHRAVCSRVHGPDDARCHAHVRTDAAGSELDGKAGRAATPNVTPSGFGPADLRSAYNVTASGAATTIVAIVDAYGYPNAEADLAVYRAQYGLPACTTANGCFIKINQTGGTNYPRTNVGWDQEQALDLDMVSAMCPNCKIMLVQASTASLANLATSVNTAVSRGALVVSNSYGGGESGSSTYASAYNHPGKAITVSSGDSGYGAAFPATAPGAIAVGGTSLVRAGNTRGWSESAWGSGGSGCSATYAKPTWQNDALCSTRMEADISAVGDPATGVAVYGPNSQGKGTWLVFGGTSVSAPLIGGIYGALGVGPTNAAQKIWANRGTAALNDVTSGSNGACGGTYFCTAGAGYDGPTGNGTPNGPGAF